MHGLPHGITLLSQVVTAGVGAFLQGHGFRRRRFTFSRAQADRAEQIALSVYTGDRWRDTPQKSLWISADVFFCGVRAQLGLDAVAVEPGFEVGDFSVGVANVVTTKTLPRLAAATDPRSVAQRFEREARWAEAIELYRAAGLNHEFERLASTWL